MHHLALSLIKLDQRPEAEELLRSCVEKQERALGAEHPETGLSFVSFFFISGKMAIGGLEVFSHSIPKMRAKMGWWSPSDEHTLSRQLHEERLVSMTYLAALLRKKKENYQAGSSIYGCNKSGCMVIGIWYVRGAA